MRGDIWAFGHKSGLVPMANEAEASQDDHPAPPGLTGPPTSQRPSIWPLIEVAVGDERVGSFR
jgi:hypothetical protein